MIVRDALPEELAEVGEIRVSAYLAGGHMSRDSGYAPVLRALGAQGGGTVLVAVSGQDHAGQDHADQDVADQDRTGQDDVGQDHAGQDHGRILGTIMLQRGSEAGEVVPGEDEAEDEAAIRALAVSPEGQGKGIGSALLQAAIERAEQTGVRNLFLLTQTDMLAAQRLYRRAGFRRLPGRDWSPRPGVTLLAYGLQLNAGR